MSPPRVIYVGDQEWPEFAEPLHWLAARANVVFADGIESAVEMLNLQHNPFDLLIVAQLRPGQYAHSAFDSLRSVAPLTPIVCLLGSYCQGETRTGKPWPGALRVYAHQFTARVGRQFERWVSHAAMAWTPPFTTTEEDRLLASPRIYEHGLTARVAVFSDLPETASALCDVLRAAGCSAAVQCDGVVGDEFDVAIWDCQGDFAVSQSSFERLIERYPQTAKIVLIGFPRIADQAAALSCGAAAVMSKPFLIDDLLWQLRQCLVKPLPEPNRA